MKERRTPGNAPILGHNCTAMENKKDCLFSRWGQNTNANENWRKKTNNYVSEEGRLSSLRNAAQQCSEVLTRRCHNIPKDAQMIREPLLMSNWSVVKEENKWWCRRRMLPSYAYLPDHLMWQKWGKCSGISNTLLFAWIKQFNRKRVSQTEMPIY